MFIGTFHLSCVALSMVNVLENKFLWAQVLCSQKDIHFSVTDSSLATTYGNNIQPLTTIHILQHFFFFFHTDEESGLTRLSDEAISAQRNLIVYTDIYRIEQVLRNFITNAVSSEPA